MDLETLPRWDAYAYQYTQLGCFGDGPQAKSSSRKNTLWVF